MNLLHLDATASLEFRTEFEGLWPKIPKVLKVLKFLQVQGSQ